MDLSDATKIFGDIERHLDGSIFMGEFFVVDIAMMHLVDLLTSIFAWAMFEIITMCRSHIIDAFSSSMRSGFSLIAVTFIIDMSVNHFQSFL